MTRLLVAAVLGLLVLVPGVAAAQELSAPPAAVAVHAAPTTTAPPAGTQTTQPGVRIDQQQQEADAKQNQRKLVLGVISIVLVGIVLLGHSVRAKRKKKTEAATG